MSRQNEEYYILSKSKTIKFGKRHFMWWRPNKQQYTSNLREAGVYAFEELEDIIKPFNRYEVNTTSIAIPKWVVNEIFNNEETVYSEDVLINLQEYTIHLVGSLDWNLSDSLLS